MAERLNQEREAFDEALKRKDWTACRKMLEKLRAVDFGVWFNARTRYDREHKWHTGEYRDFSTARDLDIAQEQD